MHSIHPVLNVFHSLRVQWLWMSPNFYDHSSEASFSQPLLARNHAHPRECTGFNLLCPQGGRSPGRCSWMWRHRCWKLLGWWEVPWCCRQSEVVDFTRDRFLLWQAGTTTPSQVQPFIPAEDELVENLPEITHVNIINNWKKRDVEMTGL